MALRVLLVCPDMHPREGGPPRVVSGSAVALAAEGLHVEIAALGEPQDEPATRASWPELAKAGVVLHRFPRGWPRVIGRSHAFNRFVSANAHRFDLVHVHCVWETSLADAAAIFIRAGKPVLLSPHGMLDRVQLRRSALKKGFARRFMGTGAMLRGAAAILYGTAEEADETVALKLPARVVIMPNGVEPFMLDDAAHTRKQLVGRFPMVAQWRRTVLFFSRLHPKKGLDMLVKAFGRIVPEFPDAGLIIAGIAQDQAYERKIADLIATLAPTNIFMTTELVGPAAREVFALADIFSLPSHQEGFSIAIIEAASAGLPLLVTDRCHMAEIEADGAGVVVPATVEGLEAGLRHLLAFAPDALAAMGRKSASLLAARYTWSRIAARLVGVYGAVIGEKGC